MSGYSAQGSTLSIGGASAGAKAISAMAPGNPTIFTSVAHGLNNGDVGPVANVVGTVAANVNGTTRVISNKTANTFALLNLDSTGLTYTSGGTFTPATWTQILGFLTFDGFSGSATEIETTDMQSVSKEFLSGLKDEGNFSFALKTLRLDPGQIALRAARDSGAVVPMMLTTPDGRVVTFNVIVKTMPLSGAKDSLLQGTIETKISGPAVLS